MKRTVDEKVAYNSKQDTPKAAAYVVGVTLYRNYVKSNDEVKQATTQLIDSAFKRVHSGRGDEADKALIAGYRDAANERKARKNPLS